MAVIDRFPLIAAAKSAATPDTVKGSTSADSAARCFASARWASITIAARISSFRAFTSFSRSSRTRRDSAAMSSIVRKSSSIDAVWLSACRFWASSRSSTSRHHFTDSSASAKSWSVASVRLTLRIAARAVSRNAGRLLAMTAPSTSIRRAGSVSGEDPTTAGAASASTSSVSRSRANCPQPSAIWLRSP